MESVIHTDPDIIGGTPVFIGTRVPVKNLFDYMAGSGLEEFLHQFPSVHREQALAVIRPSGGSEVNDRRELAEIDLSEVKDSEQLQLLLMNSLEFPGWYGRNWNAFWDAITGLVEMPRALRFRSWERFAERLPDDAELLRECLDEMSVMYPESAANVVYNLFTQ